MTEECKFCELYSSMKEMNRESDKEINSRPGRSFKVKSALKVSLIDITYRCNDGERPEECGRLTHRARPLRYCPECGKKLTQGGKRKR